jgi:uncharacterized membrane protein (Fun14 family)
MASIYFLSHSKLIRKLIIAIKTTKVDMLIGKSITFIIRAIEVISATINTAVSFITTCIS